ncbi:hypothetical protein BDU57DRAFT_453484 [Ampelomyces quisqualis]|uniref:Uncharacterized protein n=1 Tax=Ampelomyces quisqualis TaxID=50730 RepID=A0A6A5QH82_AMPQU|nr:hypothetical protein BDU57DRAFT_453484 [Ampelomyces quisqualis]
MFSPTLQPPFANIPHHPSKIIYSSPAPLSFAHLMHRLYDPSLPPIAPHIRVLSFHPQHDTLSASGIIKWLGTLPPALAVASDMLHALFESYPVSPAAVPTRLWFQVIVQLVRCCANVETVEVPAEWGDVRWYEGVFPLIDASTKRQLGNGRWRWGRDWGVTSDRAAYMGERSLEMD